MARTVSSLDREGIRLAGPIVDYCQSVFGHNCSYLRWLPFQGGFENFFGERPCLQHRPRGMDYPADGCIHSEEKCQVLCTVTRIPHLSHKLVPVLCAFVTNIAVTRVTSERDGTPLRLCSYLLR